MTAARVLDTNVILRLVVGDHGTMSPAARELMARVENGEERVVITPMIVAEVVFTLQRFYGAQRADIAAAVEAIIRIPDVEVHDQAICLEALRLFRDFNISFADAYTAATMLQSGFHEIYSWDRDFDRISGITRVEPPSANE